MKKLLAGLAAVCGVTLVAAGVLLAILLKGDLNPYRHMIAGWVAEATGRSLALDGDLSLDLSMRPTIRASQVRFGNAPWASEPEMFSAGRIEAQVDLVALLRGTAGRLRLRVEDAALHLEERADGLGNWQLQGAGPGPREGPAGPPPFPAIVDVIVQRAHVTYRSEAGRSATRLALEHAVVVRQAGDAPLELDIEGAWDDRPLHLSGTLAAPGQWVGEADLSPIRLRARALGIAMEVRGRLSSPLAGGELDLRVTARAASLDPVRAIVGPAVPAGAALDLDLTLAGTPAGIRSAIELQVGQGRLSAGGTLDLSAAPPHFSGALEVAGFDLVPLLAAPPAIPGPAPAKLPSRLDVPLDLAPLHRLDASIELTARELFLPGLTIRELDADIEIEAGRLAFELQELAADELEARGRVTIDAGGATPALGMSLELSSISPALLGASGPVDLAMSGEVSLESRGVTVRDLIEHLRGESNLTYRSESRGHLMEVRLTRSQELSLLAEGTWETHPLRVSASLGVPALLLAPGEPLPLVLAAEGTGASLQAEGSIADPLNEPVVRLRGRADADNLGGIGALLGAALPGVSPVAVRFELEAGASAMELTRFDGSLGETRLSGTARLDMAPLRPKLSARLRVSDLDARRWLPSESPEPAEPVRPASSPAKLFSADPLPFELLEAADVDLQFRAENVRLVAGAFRSFTGTLKMDGGRLTLHLREPGEDDTALVVDAVATADPPSLMLGLVDPTLEAASVLADTPAAGLLEGTFQVSVDLQGEGRSVREIMASLDGRLRLLMNEGRARARALDRLVGGTRAVAGQFFSRDSDYSTINCMVSDLQIQSGEAVIVLGLVDTEYSTILAQGTVDLASEQLDLEITPSPKGVTLSVAVPVHITGQFTDPTYDLREAAGLVRAGELFTKIVFPAALLVDVFDELAAQNPCVAMVARARPSLFQRAAGGVTSGAGTVLEGIGRTVGGALKGIGSLLGDDGEPPTERESAPKYPPASDNPGLR